MPKLASRYAGHLQRLRNPPDERDANAIRYISPLCIGLPSGPDTRESFRYLGERLLMALAGHGHSERDGREAYRNTFFTSPTGIDTTWKRSRERDGSVCVYRQPRYAPIDTLHQAQPPRQCHSSPV